MVSLRKTLQTAHDALEKAGINHALIGGLALATLGINRATADVDLMVDGEDRVKLQNALSAVGFVLRTETAEVLHFEGMGNLDILLANRPLSKKMLGSAPASTSVGMKCLVAEDIIGLKIQAYVNDSKREYQDKADIRALIAASPSLDWEKIKLYADLFGQWDEIQKIRSKA